MERLDFYRLSRAVQERLAGVTRGQGIPTPLAFSHSKIPPGFFLWAGIGLAGLAGLLLSYVVGLGNPDSFLAIHSPKMIAVEAVFGTALVVGLLQGFAALKRAAKLPYRSGLYLFPTLVLEAKGRSLLVYRLSESVRVDTSGGKSLRIALPEGRTIEFATKGAEHTQQIATALNEGQIALAKATAAQDKAARAALDPISEPNFVNPFTPKKSIAPEAPNWATYWWAIGPAAGAVLGVSTFYLHNRSSDARLLAIAMNANTPQAYHLYLERGGKERDVAEVLLPRSELREALRSGSVEAVEQFAKAHPASRVDDEIKIALRNAMLVELARLSKVGAVSGLVEFRQRHDIKHISAEFDRALHALYRAAFDRYKAGAANNPQTLAVIERLLEYAEKHGPKVELRFQRKIGKTVEAADTQIKKNPYFAGDPSYPSQYFDEARSRKREEEYGSKIVGRFNEAFSSDVLRLEQGAPITDPEATLPAVTRPTFFVEHIIQMSGPSYLNAKPRGVFVGLGMSYELSFRMPEDTKPAYKWKTTVWRPPDTQVEPGPGSFEEFVYVTAASEAYKILSQRLLQTFFKNADHAPPT